jgi:hypothetical protein
MFQMQNAYSTQLALVEESEVMSEVCAVPPLEVVYSLLVAVMKSRSDTCMKPSLRRQVDEYLRDASNTMILYHVVQSRE